MTQLTAEQLKEKLKSNENFVLDLYATWCGPCKTMLNNLKIISESDEKRNYQIYKYDIDSDRDFVIDYLKIRSVPTIKIFKEGNEVFSKSGVMSVSDVLNQMSNY